MAADPKDPRTKRRQAMGDDPNKVSMAPQPLPGAPQGQGNMMNYPAQDTGGMYPQMGQQIGQGSGQFPYGDMKMDGETAQQLGTVGFVGRSNVPNFVVPGRGLNSPMPYNAQPVPNSVQMAEMEPMYEKSAAAGDTMPNGLNNNQPVSYPISAMGPSGGPAVPGALPGQLNYMRPTDLPLGGNAMADSGMSTGRGGGRNKSKKG